MIMLMYYVTGEPEDDLTIACNQESAALYSLGSQVSIQSDQLDYCIHGPIRFIM